MHNDEPIDLPRSNSIQDFSKDPAGQTDANRFARNINGKLLDVFDIDPSNRYSEGPYLCLSCSNALKPALGRIRRHHFKHKAGRPPNCYQETYLHQLAKITVASAIERAIQLNNAFWLTREHPIVCSYHQEQYGFVCTSRFAPHGINLAIEFDVVQLEAGINGFVADVLLQSDTSDAAMMIEIAVTHPCEERKRTSGIPIIEISVQSEEEALRLQDGIDGRSNRVFFYNLPEVNPVPAICDKPCKINQLALLAYKSGKIWYSELESGSGIDTEILSDPDLITYKIVDPKLSLRKRPWRTVKEHLCAFMFSFDPSARKQFRSCLFCRNNLGQVSDFDIQCSAHERSVWMSSSALNCAFYDPARDHEEAKEIVGRLAAY